ncbi:hypothetical protein AVEN_76470-1 [Araneus ventricosus]|uniref:Uncharacterized protein n=1 Tax=Araneus ventricosus TaxID=182803 RepID=A0A4Y2CEY0_ARAVE|nr:hypothetical protein AVEN_76470-1 [Araneus ventricosus]
MTRSPRQFIGHCGSRIIALIMSGSCDDSSDRGTTRHGRRVIQPHHYYIPPGSETLLTYTYTAGSHPHICGASLSGNPEWTKLDIHHRSNSFGSLHSRSVPFSAHKIWWAIHRSDYANWKHITYGQPHPLSYCATSAYARFQSRSSPH